MSILGLFIPLRLVGKNNYRAYVTFGLLIAMLVVFFWEVILTMRGGQPIDNYLKNYAFETCRVGHQPLTETVIDGVRAIFMTTSVVTMLINMLFLWIFGPLVERFLGGKRYLTFFMLAGLGGYAFSVLLGNPHDCEVLWGPNSAISGLIAAFIFLYPTKRIETNLPAFFNQSFDFPAFLFGFVYLGIQFLSEGGGPLSGDMSPVWDELGGFLVGFIFIFLLTLFKPAPQTDPFEYLDGES